MTAGELFGEFFAPARPVDLRPDALAEVVARTARAIETDDDRVAASVWFLGAAARLVSPPFGAAALAPDPDAAAMGRAIHDDLVAAAGTALVDAVAESFRVSRQILWGNIASAVNGARVVVTTARPELAHRAATVAGAVLDGALLTGAWEVGGRGFRRRSCCQYYRVPDGGLCGDCVLGRAPR